MKDFAATGHLQFLLHTPEAFRQRLTDPCPATWVGAASEEHYRSALGEIENRLPCDGGIRDLWLLRRVAEYLAGYRHAPEWVRPLLLETPGWSRILPGMQKEAILDGSWVAVPVVLVLGRQKALRYFIAGKPADGCRINRKWPQWADSLLDHAAAHAVEQAAGAAMAQNEAMPQEATLFVFPLADPNRENQIRGASLGLPVALGFRMALEGREYPQWLAATGFADSGGRIRSVSNVTEKHALSFERGFSLFLHPAENCNVFVKPQPETLAVESLSDAQLVATLFHPGNSAELALLMTMKKDARAFTDNCLSVPRQWLAYILRPGKRDFLKEHIRCSPGLFESLVKNLDTALSRYEIETAQHLASLLGPDDAGALAEEYPGSWFSWCTCNLALCNHRGNVSSARLWANAADRVKQRAMAADDALKEVANYYNNQLVGMLHNQYDFSPVLPEGFEKHLKHLENRFQSDQELNPSAASGRLGELYGTLTQHFAFCGPAYLDRTMEYSRLARRAFGDGRTPELRFDWKRQYNYLAYAFLDAGDFSAAESSLMTYLEADSWDAIRKNAPDYFKWDHALIARFLADTRRGVSRTPLIEALIHAPRDNVKPEHPWQLWYFNMGRVFLDAGDPERAEAFFRKSLEFCLLEKFGPTVRVMALLPLSALSMHGFTVDRGAAEPAVNSAAMALNMVHFAFLDELTFPDALHYVYRNTSSVFPFSYR